MSPGICLRPDFNGCYVGDLVQAAPTRFRLLALDTKQRYVGSCLAEALTVLRKGQISDAHQASAVILTATHIQFYRALDLVPILTLPLQGIAPAANAGICT